MTAIALQVPVIFIVLPVILNLTLLLTINKRRRNLTGNNALVPVQHSDVPVIWPMTDCDEFLQMWSLSWSLSNLNRVPQKLLRIAWAILYVILCPEHHVEIFLLRAEVLAVQDENSPYECKGLEIRKYTLPKYCWQKGLSVAKEFDKLPGLLFGYSRKLRLFASLKDKFVSLFCVCWILHCFA